MSHDPILDEVAAMMREDESAIDDELEAYARGTLTDEARRALEARAAADPELARALVAFSPLPAALLATIAQPAPDRLPRAWRRPAFGGALLVAAGVAIGLFSLGSPVTPLPDYSLDARVADAEWRGGGDVRASSARADTELDLRLVPKRTVEGAVEGRLFILSEGRISQSNTPAEIAKGGAVRWRATAERLTGVRTGTVTVVAFVGRPGTLPDAAAAGDPPPAGVATARVVVVVRPAPP